MIKFTSADNYPAFTSFFYECRSLQYVFFRLQMYTCNLKQLFVSWFY
jgi:hypothetical protein